MHRSHQKLSRLVAASVIAAGLRRLVCRPKRRRGCPQRADRVRPVRPGARRLQPLDGELRRHLPATAYNRAELHAELGAGRGSSRVRLPGQHRRAHRHDPLRRHRTTTADVRPRHPGGRAVLARWAAAGLRRLDAAAGRPGVRDRHLGHGRRRITPPQAVIRSRRPSTEAAIRRASTNPVEARFSPIIMANSGPPRLTACASGARPARVRWTAARWACVSVSLSLPDMLATEPRHIRAQPSRRV